MTCALLPYNSELGKLNEFIRDYENKPEVRMSIPAENLANMVENENDEQLHEASKEPEPQPIQTGNIQDMYQLLKRALDDYNSTLDPEFTGKTLHDNLLEERAERFYKTRMKNYARDISIVIDALIKYDGYPHSMFPNYKELERLVMESEDKQHASISLRRLIAVARTIIPPDYTQSKHEVVESGIGSNSSPQDA